MKTKLSAVLWTLFLTPALLLAEEQSHSIFFLNLNYGLGNGSLVEEVEGKTTDFSGSANIFLLKIGGSLNPNWSIHYNHSTVRARADTPESLRQRGGDNVRYGIDARGIGVSYYLVSSNPYLSNLYVSPEYRFSVNAIRQTEVDLMIVFGIPGTSTTERHYSGSGFGLTVGKEWWVRPNWGLGLALFYHSDRLRGEKYINVLGVEEEYNASARLSHFGFLLSVTYH